MLLCRPVFYPFSPDTPTHSVVIHIPGGPGAFYSAQDMAPLAAALNTHGYSFLSINMRTAGNMEYARFEDYLLDIAAATRFVKGKGLSKQRERIRGGHPRELDSYA